MTTGYGDIFVDDPVAIHPVESGSGGSVAIASFVSQHYAENFARQWSEFRTTQLDSVNGTTISLDFLEDLLDAPVSSLRGKKVLEVGSGAGRFTEHLVSHADLVVATDLSEAIYLNAAIGASNAVFAQADILQSPRFRSRFDLVFCRGVLQHTPDPTKAIRVLHSLVEPGGRLVFDIYGKRGISALRPKYIWRPVVRRLFTFDSFGRFLDRWGERALRLRWRLKPFLPGPTSRVLDYLIPVWDHKGTLPLNERQLVEWSKLDTLDAMFAAYDKPMAPSEVVKVLLDLGFEHLSVDPHRNFYRVDL